MAVRGWRRKEILTDRKEVWSKLSVSAGFLSIARVGCVGRQPRRCAGRAGVSDGSSRARNPETGSKSDARPMGAGARGTWWCEIIKGMGAGAIISEKASSSERRLRRKGGVRALPGAEVRAEAKRSLPTHIAIITGSLEMVELPVNHECNVHPEH